MSQQTEKALDTRLLINVLLLCLLFFVLLNFYFVYQIKDSIKPTPGLPQTFPQVELQIITTPDCPDCFDIETVSRMIRKARLNITKESQHAWNSQEAKTIITEANITHAPALVVKGQTQSLYMEPLIPLGNQLVFDFATPPYIDVRSGHVLGRANITIIDAQGCKKCFNISTVLDQIQNVVKITQLTRVPYKDPQAKLLIKKYNISHVPSVLLSKDAELYLVVNRSWNSLGTWEEDGTMVLRSIPPPYLDTATGTTQGLIAITYLTDLACTDCYNVTIHKEVLAQLGVVFGKEERIDASSPQGKELITRYSIKAIPTILLPKEAETYPLLDQVWAQVGTVEEDGTHVFRVLEALGNIKWRDLTTGKITGVPTIVINSTSNTTTVEGGTEELIENGSGFENKSG